MPTLLEINKEIFALRNKIYLLLVKLKRSELPDTSLVKKARKELARLMNHRNKIVTKLSNKTK
jgi:hypothetical protein